MMQSPRNLLKRYPLASFFVLTYAIAWTPMLLLLVSGNDSLVGLSFFAPAISAFVLAIAGEGQAGLRRLVSRLFIWRVKIKWYLLALLAPILLELLAIPIHRLFGAPAPAVRFADWMRTLPGQLPWLSLVLVFLTLSAVGEELGWRGYAMPGLYARYGSVRASLVLGVLWGCWHLPTFWIPGSPQYGLPAPGYVLAAIGYTLIYTCLYHGARGSVLLSSLYHGASNLTLTYINILYPQVIGDLYLSLPALALLAAIVILFSGPDVFLGKRAEADCG